MPVQYRALAVKRCVDWASPVPPFMTFIIFCRIFTTHDIVSMLEDENVAANIFIEPNDGGVTDEDSGDEDGSGFLNNLSGNQLNAPAELVISGQRFGSLEEAAQSLENPNCSDSQPNNTNSTAHPQAARSLENPNYSDSQPNSTAHPQENEEFEKSSYQPPKWRKNKSLPERNVLFPEADYSKYRDFSPPELFELFLDDELYELG